MSNQKTGIFSKILLIARPAAGKSEIIAYLKELGQQEREDRFRIGRMREIDDFPMLWAWFEEDRILEDLGHPRLHTDPEGYFKHTYLWDVLIRRVCLEYRKLQKEKAGLHQQTTVFLEFARGKEHGGFSRAFEHLTPEVLEDLAVVYIDVSWEESLRKNRARFNPERPGSILEHGLADEKMELLYRESDWEKVSAGNAEYLTIQGRRIPYAVFDNEEDYTTEGGELLGRKLEEVFELLWARKKKQSS
jgi:hypothetical protein